MVSGTPIKAEHATDIVGLFLRIGRRAIEYLNGGVHPADECPVHLSLDTKRNMSSDQPAERPGPSNSSGDAKEFIKLKVKGQEGDEIHFRLKMTTPFSKIKKNYAERVGVAAGSVRLIFDGSPVSDTDTPRGLSLEDDDVIEAFVEQIGGCPNKLRFLARGAYRLHRNDASVSNTAEMPPTDTNMQAMRTKQHLPARTICTGDVC
ncbi:small ubiquitin-related modifier-like [Tropilaelaps mercedesae]|uniref:Small ubiquitin-related modifier-like n=1 Tax=Tropilaelaps mercedesae TaxID=418985 RepID=A0A1V9X708_9ACAR|nr:small ubiquitin-related modifier-like [Tropilaelaps mercedesae]